jgi:hypothetical protein
MNSTTSFSGNLAAKVARNARKAPILWRISNGLRPSLWLGWILNMLAIFFTKLTGIPTLIAELRAVKRQADGTVIDYGVLSYRVVTNAGVAFLVDDWDNDATNITDMNYHASGTGTAAENATDTALGTEATSVTDRATGTKSQPAANQLRSVGTQTYTGTAAITEHGLFSTATESAGTLWDRSVFSAINVVDTDTIQWTYTCTLTAGS